MGTTHKSSLVRESNALLQRRLDARDQADNTRKGQETYDQALSAFERMTVESTGTPLASAMATKDPKRLRALATAIVKQDATLQDDEILAMIETDLEFYSGLRTSSPPTQVIAAPSEAPLASVKPTSEDPVEDPPSNLSKADRLAASRVTAMQRTKAAIEAVRVARQKRDESRSAKAR